MAETVTIHGLAELEKRLQALPEYIKRGGLINRALLVGAKMIRDQAKKNAPVYDTAAARKAFASRRFNRAGYKLWQSQQVRVPMNLKSNIVSHLSRQQSLTAIVRVRTKTYIFAQGKNYKSNNVNNPNYWWLLEFGTSKMPANKFLRRAFESMKRSAADAIKDGLAAEINKANAHPLQYADSQRPRRSGTIRGPGDRGRL